MDPERAELHLRRLAEASLRDAADGHGKPPYRLSSLTGRVYSSATRLPRVAYALMAVGALDRETAGEIMGDLDIALAVRRDGVQLGHLLRTSAIRRGLHQPLRTAAGRGGPAGPRSRSTGTGTSQRPGKEPRSGPAPHRVAPAGMMLPIRAGATAGELYLLAYAHTAAGARFTVSGWVRDPRALSDGPDGMIREVTITDAKRTAYQTKFAGTIGIAECTGLLHIVPEPPPDTEWLDVSAGDVTRRVPLDAPATPADLTPLARTPGEQYLLSAATSLLTSVPTFPAGRERFSGPPASTAHGLGDVISALQAAGALSLLNPLRGQLVTLCESLGLTEHDIGAPAARDLPEQWVSLLSHHLRRKPVTAPLADGAAGAAIALPPVDGVTISVLGLHNGMDGTVLHVSAVLPPGHPARSWAAYDPPELWHALPLIWLRDDGGRWHATRRLTAVEHPADELMLTFAIVPSLPRTAIAEILVSGADAEVRARLPLRWR